MCDVNHEHIKSTIMKKVYIINLYFIHLDLITALTGLNIDEKDDGKHVLFIR